ncbi:MAG: sigma-70 family RNA polymerase sigma factor [Acidimicrobiia bacterium]
MTRFWTWHEIELDPGPGAPVHVRAWLGVVFGLTGSAAVDLEVIASELVLCAIEGGVLSSGDGLVVTADRPPGAVHVEVTSPVAGARPPDLPDVVTDVLEARASVWGRDIEGDRLTTWFEIVVPSTGFEFEDADDADLIERMPVDERAAAELTDRYEPLVRRFIARYRRAGLETDDLYQVGQEALLRAAARFDPSLGSFERFVSRTISGTLKKHLRDRGWSVRPPRGLQELVLEVRGVESDLLQRLGRSPSVDEIAAESGRPPAEIDRARRAAAAFTGDSIDAAVEPEGVSLSDRLGFVDAAVSRAASWAVVDRAVSTLGERDREILRLRYFEDLSQRQIAERVGVSQMQVSRLLRASIESLRQSVGVSAGT